MPSGGVISRSLSRLSLRKKRSSRHEERLESSVDSRPPPASDARELATSTTTTNPPSTNVFSRGMDRIRKSLRRRGGDSRPELIRGDSGGGGGGAGGVGTGELWQPDEAAVRAGLCSFNVKYLGAVEVFESRGMQVCEGALKMLRTQNKQPVKAVLYVSGDGLRLVDQQNNRGLLLDQTIEKVSFCAPDRNHTKGFAYICREGSSRRWMCHGFHAINYPGERLSHAVGCAFAVCLERKKKRDEDTVVTADKALNPNWGDSAAASVSTSNSTDGAAEFARGVNPSYASFRRQLSIQERVADPQTAIVPEAAALPAESSRLPPPEIAKPRPAPNPNLFMRQGSLRAPVPDDSAQFFRRHNSLRSHDAMQKKKMLHADPIAEADESSISTGLDNSALLLPDVPSLPSVPHQILSTNSTVANGESAAEQWLQHTLRHSLSLSSPPPPPSPPSINWQTQLSPTGSGWSGPPPSHPPPPLPPSAMYASPHSSLGNGVFHQQNATSYGGPEWQSEQAACGVKKESDDPFDVHWSRAALAASSQQPQPTSVLF